MTERKILTKTIRNKIKWLFSQRNEEFHFTQPPYLVPRITELFSRMRNQGASNAYLKKQVKKCFVRFPLSFSKYGKSLDDFLSIFQLVWRNFPLFCIHFIYLFLFVCLFCRLSFSSFFSFSISREVLLVRCVAPGSSFCFYFHFFLVFKADHRLLYLTVWTEMDQFLISFSFLLYLFLFYYLFCLCIWNCGSVSDNAWGRLSVGYP